LQQQGKLPDWIKNAPQLENPALAFFLKAFYDLDSCRAQGMGLGCIPYTAVSVWCDDHEVCGELRESVWYHIKALDSVYLKTLEPKKKGKKPSKNDAPRKRK
jgi:hypothetical protein